MKRWLIILLMVLGITLLPSSLHAPSTSGQILAQTANTSLSSTTVATVVPTGLPQLILSLPFKVESRWGSGDENLPGIWWETNQGTKYFVIQNGQFVSNDPTDTWFVYGWFGPLSAIKEDYNIKYPEWGDRHNGIDFAGREGVEVVSATDGTVVFAGDKIGNTVIVKTNDYQITYGHLQDINVRVGDRVSAGQLIGHLGKTGTINPHLHFQLDYLKNDKRIAINPVPLIQSDWSNATIPSAPSNLFYAGPADPKLQPNFSW